MEKEWYSRLGKASLRPLNYWPDGRKSCICYYVRNQSLDNTSCQVAGQPELPVFFAEDAG